MSPNDVTCYYNHFFFNCKKNSTFFYLVLYKNYKMVIQCVYYTSNYVKSGWHFVLINYICDHEFLYNIVHKYGWMRKSVKSYDRKRKKDRKIK